MDSFRSRGKQPEYGPAVPGALRGEVFPSQGTSKARDMNNNASLVYSLFLVIGDFLALVAAFAGAYILRVSLDPRHLVNQIPALTYLEIFLALLPFWIIIFFLLGLYNSTIYEKRFLEAGRLLVGSFIGLLFVIFYNFISRTPVFPARLVPIYAFCLAFLFLLIFRNLARVIRVVLFSYNIGLTHVLIVGNTEISKELVRELRNSRKSGYKVVGLVTPQTDSAEYKNVKLFQTFKEAVAAIGADDIHAIVQTELYPDPDRNNAILKYAQEHHIAYRFVPGNSELFVGKIEVDLFRQQIPVIAVHQTALIGWGRVVKRLFDLSVAITLLVLVSPVFLLIALLNYVFGDRSVFFRQTRLTRFNHEFKVYKFRSQYRKYDGTTPEQFFAMIGKPELAVEYRKNGDSLPHDPRLTPIGGFLRKTSLDELPQLLNVIRGELSLVGPRALIPQELAQYDKRHTILSVKSGITGLAQVSGRRNISFEERRKLDMYYVQNWSFWMDITILLKTARVILAGEGAK
jgi:exopolysaccharide biosynthesis polyprenyl glycosylphosphotransferase